MSKVDVKNEINVILLSLEDAERRLLTKVIRIERDNLHIPVPNLKSELIAAVKGVIK